MAKKREAELVVALRKAALFLVSDDYSLDQDEACRIALILAEVAGVIGMAGGLHGKETR